jgi:hypothetical protein
MMQSLMHLPYCLAETGPSSLHGVGNYLLQVKSYDPYVPSSVSRNNAETLDDLIRSATTLLTLYFLDSGAYIPNGFAWWKPLEYDYLRESQIEWYLSESSAIDPIERPFTPDGGKDLGKIWRKRRAGMRRMDLEERQAAAGGNASGGKKLAKPNAMMFFHIPL